jgi:hypothetical protein
VEARGGGGEQKSEGWSVTAPRVSFAQCLDEGSGGGGGIRTRDLWVMSPTSCRCSTPRHPETLRMLPTSGPGAGGARDGLASHRAAPAVLSGAAAGHDRVRDGTGWGHRALGHGRPRPPNQEVFACCFRSNSRSQRSLARVAHTHHYRSVPPGERSPTLHLEKSALVHAHGSAPVCCQPSTPRRSTWSSPRELTSCEWGSSSWKVIPA